MFYCSLTLPVTSLFDLDLRSQVRASLWFARHDCRSSKLSSRQKVRDLISKVFFFFFSFLCIFEGMCECFSFCATPPPAPRACVCMSSCVRVRHCPFPNAISKRRRRSRRASGLGTAAATPRPRRPEAAPNEAGRTPAARCTRPTAIRQSRPPDAAAITLRVVKHLPSIARAAVLAREGPKGCRRKRLSRSDEEVAVVTPLFGRWRR